MIGILRQQTTVVTEFGTEYRSKDRPQTTVVTEIATRIEIQRPTASEDFQPVSFVGFSVISYVNCSVNIYRIMLQAGCGGPAFKISGCHIRSVLAVIKI